MPDVKVADNPPLLWRNILIKNKDMGQKKKNRDIPPASYVNKIIALSHASTWEEAKREWKFLRYYNASESYVACYCSPRSAKNVVVLVNDVTLEEVTLCNSCAEDYFGIYDGDNLEKSVRRLKKNSDLGMNLESLYYLYNNTILNVREVENYEVALPCRNCGWLLDYKARINEKLLVFTNYKYREAFDKLDCLFVEVVKNGTKKDVDIIALLRYKLLTTGTTDFDRINNLIANYNIDINNRTLYSYERKKLALESFEYYIRPSLLDWLHESDYFKEKIRTGQARILPHHAEYEPGFDKDRYLESRKSSRPKVSTDGLEEGIDMSCYEYEEEEDWEEKINFNLMTQNMVRKADALIMKNIIEIMPEFNVQYLFNKFEMEQFSIAPDSTIESFIDDLFDRSMKCSALVIQRLYEKMTPEAGKYFIKQINGIYSKAKIKLKIENDTFIFCNSGYVPDYIEDDYRHPLVSTEGLEEQDVDFYLNNDEDDWDDEDD